MRLSRISVAYFPLYLPDVQTEIRLSAMATHFISMANWSSTTCLSLFQLAPHIANCLDSGNFLIPALILASYMLSNVTIYKEQYRCSFWTILDPNFLFSSTSGFRFLWLTCNTGFLAPTEAFGKLQTVGFTTTGSQATADSSSSSTWKIKYVTNYTTN